MVISENPHIVVVGLGYVGLPLAIVLAKHFKVTGFDIDQGRVDELKNGHDRTREIDAERLGASSITLTSDKDLCRGADVYIVTVPTPVDHVNRPDLRPVISATRTVGELMTAGHNTIVVYESTVYPGVTEDICGPELEKVSGLKRGVDFWLGYSPERINPGDKEHTVDRIIKVVSGETPEVLKAISAIYGRVTSAGTFEAASIKAAEAAKVIENAQRDINIAFVNEITQIFAKIDVSIWDVLAAAGTKWNFLKFQPGLVGGHCIGVDPYYLSSLATEVGLYPRVILAGRGINDGMGHWMADRIHDERGAKAGSVLMLGITFKENVPDIRNSKVIDVINRLKWLGHTVEVHDPLAYPEEVTHEYGLTLSPALGGKRYDTVMFAVPHDEYSNMDAKAIEALLNPGGLVADIKGVWREKSLDPSFKRWSL